ncbi:MAG: hypothetical protein U0183_11940 [Polyangiaceae bacterium]
MAKPRSLFSAALKKTGLSEQVRAEIEGIHGEYDAAYRERFTELAQAIVRQASALDRIQRTLEMLVEHSAPNLRGRVPGLRLAQPGEEEDVATVGLAVADPIGQGYALGQQELAEALRCSQPQVSQLLKIFLLKDDPELAIVVRRGKKREIVNYHPRAIERLAQLLENPPRSLTASEQDLVRRVQRRRGML